MSEVALNQIVGIANTINWEKNFDPDYRGGRHGI